MDPETKTIVTITIRLIRSFTHTNWKPCVLHNIDLNMSTEELMKTVYETLPNAKAKLPTPFISYKGYDTLKIETRQFGFKSNDPLINREDDDKLVLKPGSSLEQQGVSHETEISFFNYNDYLEYKKSKPL